MTKRRRWLQKMHRWLGLLLGLQVVVWMSSGVVMSWFHIAEVRGERSTLEYFPPDLAVRSYASPGGVIVQTEGAHSVRLKTFLDRPVYVVEGAYKKALFDAVSGAPLSPINEATARKVAERDFVGDGEIASISLMSETPQEYRGSHPVWRADFDDDLSTRLYISPQTGEVLSRRNRTWRIYDFFWMLHIMDYGEREDFNNPLIRAASATGLMFALSGLALVVIRLKNGRYLKDLKRRSDKQE